MNILKLRIPVIIICFWALQSCSIDSFDRGTSDLTNEESLIAGQIIGESISENQNGLLSSFSEAFAVPTESSLEPGPAPLSVVSFRNLQNYSHDYDSDTGTHTVTFLKSESNEFFALNTEYELSYNFFDNSGQVIEFPAQQKENIEAVEFTASRTGHIEANTKISFFNRTDGLFMGGLAELSDILTIDGYHSGEGTFTQINADGSRIEREYLLEINYLDIQINKPVVEANRNFRNGVNGALSYESTVRQTSSGNPETKSINGTIEMNGDGTALLKFKEQFDTFRLRLADGEVFDEDEFEGRVTKVNLQENIFTISNGQRIQIESQTEIEDGDFNSLAEVEAAVQQGVRVIAEGDYFHPDKNVNLWIATEVEFELESSEFEDLVTSFNLSRQTFTLANGDTYHLTESSEIEFEEDSFTALIDVEEAVNSGLPVLAEGDFHIDLSTGSRIVREVEFELEFEDFDEEILSVDLQQRSFTIESGKTILVTENTIIDPDGDYFSLEEIAEELQNEEEIIAEGKLYFDSEIGFWIAHKVEFSD